MDDVYHFTDTTRLPFILKSGFLEPSRNKIGGFPDPDFVWATTNKSGDGSASGMQGYKTGVTRLVRITLPAEHFRPWREIVADFPEWTPEQAARLERAAKGRSDPRDWLCRAAALPVDEIISIESKSYRGAWEPLKTKGIGPIFGFPGALAIEVAGRLYVSTPIEGPNGAQGFRIKVLTGGYSYGSSAQKNPVLQ